VQDFFFFFGGIGLKVLTIKPHSYLLGQPASYLRELRCGCNVLVMNIKRLFTFTALDLFHELVQKLNIILKDSTIAFTSQDIIRVWELCSEVRDEDQFIFVMS
jgi:hypothetical protein